MLLARRTGRCRSHFLIALLLTADRFPPTLRAQTPSDSAALKKQAVELDKAGKFEDALPLVEKLNTDKPNDPIVLEGLAFSTLAHARTLSDPEARNGERI